MTWKWSTIGAQQRPRTSIIIIIIIIIIIRLSVTLVAWWGISFWRDSQPMLILVLTRTKKKKQDSLAWLD